MKIRCNCGGVIVDQTDSRPHKAHLIADEDWFTVFEKLDELIGQIAAGRKDIDQAETGMRSVLVNLSRQVWQCPACGLLLIDDHRHDLNLYAPCEESDSRSILRGKDVGQP